MKTYKLKLFNFFGSPVKLNLLFLFILLLVPISYAIGIFISILVHEMAHIWMAERKGYKTYGIEISLFSGMAMLDSNIHERDHAIIAAVGPFSNLILSIIAFLLGLITNNNFVDTMFNINLILFLFNILPIKPMDGNVIFTYFSRRKFGRSKGSYISKQVSIFTACYILFLSIIATIVGYNTLFISIFLAILVYYNIKND